MTSTFTFGDTTIRLRFSLDAWEKMHEEVCPLDEFFDMYDSRNRAKLLSWETMKKTLQIACILAWAAGGQPEVTYDQLRGCLSPAEALDLRNTIIDLVSKSMIAENKGKSGPRDLVLEELEGKN
jgi:hypothetical protein